MELGSIIEFLDNKTLLVTGATGFLAKLLVEKILRTQPKIKKIYLLVRASDMESANQRLHKEIVGKELFKVVKENMKEGFNGFISDKVKMVAGDVTFPDLGIKEFELKQQIFDELDVIINSSATTNFYDRYDASLLLNTFGVENMLGFAKKCVNLKALVHVSTAYVSGEKEGLISEIPFKMGETLNGTRGLNIEKEKKIMENKLIELQQAGASPRDVKSAMKELGLKRANKYGWPNVYVFTKAMGEMIMMKNKEKVPLIIIRPTIITSTYKEPFPGWIEGVKTLDTLAVGVGKGSLSFLPMDPDTVLDVIPGDMVVNAMLVGMVARASQFREEAIIYHVGSSLGNPITAVAVYEATYSHFKNNPWINKDGSPVTVQHCKLLESADSFKNYVAYRCFLPLKALEWANTLLFRSFAAKYDDLKKKVDHVLRLLDFYRPYLLFKGIFDDANTEQLRIAAREGNIESDMFYFDPKEIDWNSYFLYTHLPGILKYGL